jgi:DNA-binding NarL/FixJ family response regulator
MSQSEEQAIINLLADGLTAQEIADETNCTVRTINFRLQVIYAKYNVPPGKHRNIKLLKAAGYIKEKNHLRD